LQRAGFEPAEVVVQVRVVYEEVRRLDDVATGMNEVKYVVSKLGWRVLGSNDDREQGSDTEGEECTKEHETRRGRRCRVEVL